MVASRPSAPSRVAAVGEGHVLGVAERWVGLGVAVLVEADVGVVVVLAEGQPERLPLRRRERDAVLAQVRG